MKRLAAFFLGSLIFFAGCDEEGSDIDNLPPDEELQMTTVDTITIGKPPSWNFLDKNERPDEFPPNILLLMTEVEPWGTGDTFATIAVAQEQIPTGTSAKKYAEAAVNKTEQEIVNFERIEEANWDVANREAKFLHFRGKNALDEDTLEWMHLFLVEGQTGYVVSATLPTDSADSQRDLLKKILGSFTFQTGN